MSPDSPASASMPTIEHQFFSGPGLYLLHGIDSMNGKLWREPDLGRRLTSDDFPAYWEALRFPDSGDDKRHVTHTRIEGTFGPLYWRDDLSGADGVTITLIVPPGTDSAIVEAAKRAFRNDRDVTGFHMIRLRSLDTSEVKL